ncbi:MAG: S8 family serine peptidase [Proteobacteria bacterium]|nr:S8 family serine peptidase [Pseudomonadota bacterium]
MKKNLFSLSVLFLSLFLFPQKSYALFGFGKVQRAGVPIIEATELGNGEYVKNLIEQGVDINAVDKNGQTALMRAAAAGNDQMVAILITNGADIGLQDSKGNTALHYAAANDHASTTKMLINNGAIINITNRKGQTPLELAIKNGSVYAIRVIDSGALAVVETNAGFTIAAASAAGSGISTTTIVTTAGVTAAGAGVAVAAGGGGGGGETASSGGGNNDNEIPNENPPGNPPNNPPPSPPPTSPNPFVVEYNQQQGLALIKADIAYSRGYTGNNVVVAVVDTGVDLDHVELDSRIVSGAGATFNNGVQVGNGDEEGFEITDSTTNAELNNADFWHGTHVAGIIAAEKNGVGTHGVAYNAKILPVNVYTIADKSLYNVDIAKGIDYSVANGARVINISLGGGEDAQIKTAIQNAVNFSGSDANGDKSILVAAAAGNLYADDAVSVADNPVYPARHAGDTDFNPTNVGDAGSDGALLAVAAVDNNGNLASFSHKCGDAKNWCLVAPGVSIFSDLPDNYLAWVSGTSMATPHVSGAAAVLMDMDPHLTAREVAEILLLTATDKGNAELYGHGLLNLDKATQPIGVVSVPIGNNVNDSLISLDASSITASSVFGDAFTSANLSFKSLDVYKRAYDVNMNDFYHEKNRFTVFENKFRDFGDDIIKKREKIGENISFVAVNLTDSDPRKEEHEKEEFVRMSFAADSEYGGFEFNHNVPMNQAFRLSALGDVSMSVDNVGTNSVLGLVSYGSSYNNRYVVDKNSSFSFGSFQGEQEYGDVSGVVSQYSRYNDEYELALQAGMINEQSSFLGSNTEGAFALGENTPTWFYNVAAAYNISNSVKLFGAANYGISFPDVAADSLYSMDFGGISKLSTGALYITQAGHNKDADDEMLFMTKYGLKF